MRWIIAITLLLLPVNVHAAENYFVGVRACGVDNIGPLQDTDCISIDRWDVPKGYKTTPLDIYNFVYSRMSGNVAPAAHGHDGATPSAPGFLSVDDKRRLDYQSPTSRGEGAVTGTWTSLAAAGYTVATAQAKWPSLAGVILTEADLVEIGVDWCAAQHTANAAAGGEAVISAGTHVIERTITVPPRTTIKGLSRASVIIPHTTWTGAKNLFTIPASSYEITITGLKLQENPWPVINAGQFTGVFVNSGSYRVRVEGNTGVRLARLVFIDKSSDQATVVDNDTDDVTQEVWYSKGTADDWHVATLIDDNDFLHSYKAGDFWVFQAEDGAQFTYFRVTNNRVGYQGLFRLYNVTTTVEGPSMFSEISRNRVIGIPNGNPLIY